MAPLPRPEDHGSVRIEVRPDSVPCGEEIVISGMAGKFPESNDVLSFMNNLYNKVNMVTDNFCRWDMLHPEVPPATGKLREIEKFDAQFFGVHYKQAWNQDPMARILLETSYAAVYDAGVNPRSLRNTKTGVFVGSGNSESEKLWIYEVVQFNGFGLTGCSRSLFANRISYWLGTTGPSYTIDVACSSSMIALEQAVHAIRSGQCEAALVGGCNLCLHPYGSLNLNRLGFLCYDGKTKVFDKNANGYARAEAINVLYLQKAKDAKRIYAEVIDCKSTYSNDQQTIFEHHRSVPHLTSFLNDFYAGINVLPEEVDYVEAFGIGRPESDRNELEAIDQVFCKNRKGPVYVGSVKSNAGHTEASSGVVSVTKVCLGYHTGNIAGNLHMTTPRDDVAGLREGRIRVVTDSTPFSRGYCALNSFSFTGMNVHALTKGFTKPKNLSLYETSMPRLVVASGREDAGLNQLFDDLKARAIDAEEIKLLHSIHEIDISGHMSRGYTLLATDVDNKTVSLDQTVDYCPGGKRPVWFIYSGMGSQWSSMGAELMRIPIFAAAIERCHKVLAPKGVNLVRVLTDPDPKIYDNILNSFIGIAAVQIGLTDVIKALGIKPDNIIGHSVGELGCAYADECFTAEEMILAAYFRGLVSVQTPLIRGSMAAIGLGFRAINGICPPDIFVACHNGPDSSTISGPADSMKKFVAELTAKGIFAKEVPCSNIAYHSKYIADAGTGLLKYLKKVIKAPKQRSPRWVSTSVPQEQWGEQSATFSSAEYHTNNLLNPVLFEETSRLIPANAITIEIAPHGLLQAIIKRSLPEDCTNIPLTRRGHADNVQFLLGAVGKLYIAGLNPIVANLYPTVQYPVSVGTPMLSHQVRWNHSEDWSASRFATEEMIMSGERVFVGSVHDDEYAFLKDHVRDGVNVFPESAQLVAVWETLGMILGRSYTKLSVVFEDVRFDSPVAICHDEPLKLRIMIQKSSGKFEVIHGDSTASSGSIKYVKDFSVKLHNLEEVNDDGPALDSQDVYKNLFSKGYSYSGSFQSIHEISQTGKSAQIRWRNEWVTFLDSMIQMNIHHQNSDGILVPKFIRKISIGLGKHRNHVNNTKQHLDAVISEECDFTRCGGVEIEGLRFIPKTRVARETQTLAAYEFVPLFVEASMEFDDALSIHVQLAIENNTRDKFKTVEVLKDKEDGSYADSLNKVMERTVLKEFNIESISENDLAADKSKIANVNLVVFANLLERRRLRPEILDKLSSDTFILSHETSEPKTDKENQLQIIASIAISGGVLVLFRKLQPILNTKYVPMVIDEEVSLLVTIQKELQKCDRLVLVTDQVACGQLAGLARSLRNEHVGKSVNFLETDNASNFISDLPMFKKQLDKNLAVNVYHTGKWGNYRNIPIRTSAVLNNYVQLISNEPGVINSLSWAEIPTPSPKPGKISVKVHYAAPTFRDVQVASGICGTDSDSLSRTSYGMDFCGVTSSGERVMGLIPSGSLSSVVEADPELLWPVPEHWSMEDAATVPQAYAQAFYCVAIKSHLSPGMRVLVHGGAGALGQAAISVCLALGCHVLATVSSAQKKEFLLRLFPQLKASDIGNSREISFEDTVQCATQGQGCDIIISTVNGVFRRASMRCGGVSCKLLDVTHGDMLQNEDFNMSYLWKEKVYVSVKLSTVFRPENSSMRSAIQRLVAEGVAEGWVRPLSRMVFPHSEASRAFRLLAASRHRGRVLLRLRSEKPVSQSKLPAPVDTFEATPRSSYSPEGSYVVVCGKQELGLELADWLVRRGARNLVLNLQTDKSKRYYQTKYVLWRKFGVNVKLTSNTLKSKDDCEGLLKVAASLAPVLGIFLAQNTWSCDAIATIETPEDINVAPHLDEASRKLCSQIEQFVVFTRLAAWSDGSVIVDALADRVCIKRAKLGLPSLSLKLGPIAQFGKATSDAQKDLRLSPQTVPSVLNSMEILIKLKQPVAASHICCNRSVKAIYSEISKIIGEELFSTLANSKTLGDQGIDLCTANEIKHLLEKLYGTYYPAEKVLDLTLLDLQRLHDHGAGITAKHLDEGLSQFYRFVDPDEFGATEPIFFLPTLVHDGKENEDEFDLKDAYLMLIPGMEGNHQVFRTVCERLKIRAVACQLGVDHPTETIQQMAARLYKILIRKLDTNAKYHLFAYSFGVAVALEVASLLEEQGHDGTVFCLDGSPDMFPQLLNAHIGHLDEAGLQDAVVNHMFQLMTGEESKELQNEIKGLDWQGKLDACVNQLRNRVNFSIWYKRSVVDMAYSRIVQARTYNPLLKRLRAQLVLLKAKNSHIIQGLPEDYGLSKYSEKPVKVFELESDHSSAPNDLRCSNIVNKLLDPEVLNVFNNLNLCSRYTKFSSKYSAF